MTCLLDWPVFQAAAQESLISFTMRLVDFIHDASCVSAAHRDREGPRFQSGRNRCTIVNRESKRLAIDAARLNGSGLQPFLPLRIHRLFQSVQEFERCCPKFRTARSAR
jgi:hypothetical protein